MRIVRPVVRTVGGVTHRVRDLGRLQEVARVLMRHGLGMLVAGVEIPGLPAPADRRFASTPDRVAAAFQELGPTFVKLGQVLSTRPDLLPQPYVAALQRLQDDVDAFPFAEAAATLEAELGADWRSRYRTFDEAPLATASIAQVHVATLHDGAIAAVKVQRPGIAAKIRADLNILQFLARRLLVEYPEAISFDPIGVLDEFERSITAELDFDKEARNMRRIAANFGPEADFVRVPKVFGELCTPHVLTMEYLEGVKIRDARAAGCDMAVVGQRYLRTAYDMLFVHGFFHGDLHPGNVIILPGDVIGLLDFGMVGRLTQEMRSNVIGIIFALQRGDVRTIARICYDIAIKEDRVDLRAVEQETAALVERHWDTGASVRDMQFGPYVVDLAAAAARHGARIPSAYTMFFKAIMTSEGLAKALIDEVDPIAAAEPYVRRFIRDRYSEERIRGDLFYNLVTLQSLAQRLPVTMGQLLDDVEAQRLQLTVRDPDAAAARGAWNRLANRVIFAGFTMTLVLCGALALLAPSLFVFGVPVLSLVLWLLAAPLAALTLSMVLRNR